MIMDFDRQLIYEYLSDVLKETDFSDKAVLASILDESMGGDYDVEYKRYDSNPKGYFEPIFDVFKLREVMDILNVSMDTVKNMRREPPVISKINFIKMFMIKNYIISEVFPIC